MKLKMYIVALLLRHSRHELRHSVYSLARELNINDVDGINEIRQRRIQALGSDCRIESLPDFVRIFKFNTRKRYQQLIVQSAAANYPHSVDKLLDDIYFDFYLFVHDFDSASGLASLLLYIVAVTFIALMASLIYLSQYLTDFDTVVAIAMSIEFLVVNFVLIASSYLSLKIKSLCPIIFSMLSCEHNRRRHKIWIELVERWFLSGNKLAFSVFGYHISYKSFLQANVYITSVVLLSYSELLRHKNRIGNSETL
ncbi:hypothetical protein GZH46_03067 [Fragariocoptes setiger]|uniref:Gustatory receptor n=1 Tax=Fragariocoptes setiger TaxID=1670756 RepID=A0ABQ7S511_9ACAR|nr:hypothetical protein GZH46_03067 [Fragariocoptes setiger]